MSYSPGKKAKFSPLYDRVLVKRVEGKTKTEGGIFIPETAKEKPSEGVIVATGTGRINEDGVLFPLAVSAGDKVLFGKYSGTEIQVDNEDLLIMREEEILGILQD
jgi:chaperonin GroES